MKFLVAAALVALFFAQNVAPGWSTQSDKKDNAAFVFAGVQYFHRFTKDDLLEYTPEGQEDLKRWADMVTINYYRKAKDGDGLATIANAVLENYKANKAVVLKTASVPRTPDKPAEHVIVVVFGRAEFIEAAFARFRMHDAVGTSVVYSHRMHGNNVGPEMSAWLDKNGATTEKTLMAWDAMPPRPSAK